MSSPSAGPDPAADPRGAPQPPPAWAPPPPPPPGQSSGYGPAPVGPGAPGGVAQRPGGVTAAAIIGIVMGALALISLFGVGLIFAFSGVLGLLTLLSVATGAVLLAGGIQVLQGKSPQLLLLGSYAALAVQLLTWFWALVSGWGFLFTGLLGFVLPGVIVYLLRQPDAKRHYTAQGISY